jgi:hypothetical protein
MMAWWVIEGVDGAGKSTLVTKLKHELSRCDPWSKIIVKHHSQLKQDPLIEYEKSYDFYRPGSGTHFVSDRWAWGEDVYGPIYREESKLSVPARLHIEKYAQSRGASVALLTHDAATLRKRFAERGEDYLKDRDIERVIERFDLVQGNSDLKSFTFTDPDEQDVKDFVHDGLRREEMATKLATYPTYVGPLLPEGLLLGERRNDPSWSAAFVPGKATSGFFLLNALPIHSTHKIGLANALEESVRELWETLGRPDVVALGKKASASCTEAQVPFVAVPHPQYIRRFYTRRSTEYGQAIIHGLSGKAVTFP